jgi:hypothetical protein
MRRSALSVGSCTESEHDLVRLLVAPMGELAPFAHIRKPHFVNTRIDAALSLAARA